MSHFELQQKVWIPTIYHFFRFLFSKFSSYPNNLCNFISNICRFLICVRTKLNFGWQLFIKSKTCLDAVNLLKYYINRCKSPKEKCPSDYLQSTKLSQVQITYRKSLKCADTTINLRSVKNLIVNYKSPYM